MATLQEVRKQHHLRQRDLAQSLGVSREAIHYWETGRSGPSLCYLQPLAALLSLSVEALLQTLPPKRALRRKETRDAPDLSPCSPPGAPPADPGP